MGALSKSPAFLAGYESVYGFIALEIDSTLVASERQAYILNDVFSLVRLFMVGFSLTGYEACGRLPVGK
jgi:hypothetical protein